MSKIRKKWPDFSHFDAWSKAPVWAEYLLTFKLQQVILFLEKYPGPGPMA